MAQTWPISLPDSPLLDGYETRRKNSKLRTSVDAGLDKVRNRYRAVPVEVSEAFIMSKSEKEAFQNFHDNTCDGGAERFIRDNPETGISREYRFIDEPAYLVIGHDKTGPIYRVELFLELMP